MKPEKPKPKKTSQVIKDTIADCDREGEVEIGQFLGLLGDRVFCIAILLFSLPNSLPLPGIPGFSTVTGLPIAFMALQMMLGRDTIWLPHKIGGKSFRRSTLAKLLTKALPGVIWLEKLLSPRWTALTEGRNERFIGFMLLVLALVMALPIPGGNFLPGVSMSLIALAMLEKDGRALVLSMIFSMVSLVFMYEVVTIFLGWVRDIFMAMF